MVGANRMTERKSTAAAVELRTDDGIAELRRMTRETQQHARRAFAHVRPMPQDDGEQS